MGSEAMRFAFPFFNTLVFRHILEIRHIWKNKSRKRKAREEKF